MDTVAGGIERDAAGRFVAGQSGNPAGKLPGTRNRKTVMLEALREGEGEAAARVVIEKALSGDVVSARFVVALISPRPKGRTIHLELPEDDDCNVVTAYNLTLRALCEGEITPDEAVTISRFLDGRRRVLQAWQLEERLTRFGRIIPGDPDWAAANADAGSAVDGDEDEDEDEDGFEPDEPEAALDPAADAAGAVQSACISPAPPAAPVGAAASASRPRVAAATPAPQPAAAPLQSTCISGSPGTIRGRNPIPSDGLDAALAASILRRLAAGSAPG
jgi:hypothetical protein